MTAFITLLRKDWRLNRIPVFGLALLTAAGYLIVAIAFVWDRYDMARRGITTSSRFLVDFLPAGAAIGNFLTAIIASALGGVAFAQERREGWADFLAAMPVSRKMIVVSKLIAALSAVLLFWSFNFSILCLCALFNTYGGSAQFIGDQLKMIPVTGLGVFATAWLLSTFLRSDAIAACAALAANAAGATILALILYNEKGDFVENFVLTTDAIMAVIAIVAGSIYYVRRVAP